jgi:hypothetical protein
MARVQQGYAVLLSLTLWAVGASRSLSAWDAYQRGLWHVARSSPTDAHQAQEFFLRLGITRKLTSNFGQN